MLTIRSLLEIVENAENMMAMLRSNSREIPFLRIRAANALLCAQWMTANHHDILPYCGPFGEVSFAAGDRVRVRKGSTIYTTKSPYQKISGKTNVVVITTIHAGRVDNLSVENCVIQPYVEWMGSAGHWRWTSPSNVDIVEKVR